MHGLMMNVPLTITSIIRHAERVHGSKEIVSVTRDILAIVIPIKMPSRARVSWPML